MTDAASPDENLEALKRRLGQTEHDRRLSDRALVEQCYAKIREVETSVHELSVWFESALTGADPVHHRRWHERADLQKERWRIFWRDFRNVSLIGAVIGIVVFTLLRTV